MILQIQLFDWDPEEMQALFCDKPKPRTIRNVTEFNAKCSAGLEEYRFHFRSPK